MSNAQQGNSLYLELQDLQQLQGPRVALFHKRMWRLFCVWCALIVLALGVEFGMYTAFPKKPEGSYVLCNMLVGERWISGCAHVEIAETPLSMLRLAEPKASFSKPTFRTWNSKAESWRYRLDQRGPHWMGYHMRYWHQDARWVLWGLWCLVTLLLCWILSKRIWSGWEERKMKRPLETEMLRMKRTSSAQGGISVAVDGDALRGSLTESSQGGLEVVDDAHEEARDGFLP